MDRSGPIRWVREMPTFFSAVRQSLLGVGHFKTYSSSGKSEYSTASHVAIWDAASAAHTSRHKLSGKVRRVRLVASTLLGLARKVCSPTNRDVAHATMQTIIFVLEREPDIQVCGVN